MMGDFKSKLPNLQELASMTGKLFRDLKRSMTEILKDYRTKHPAEQSKEEPKPSVKQPAAKPAAKKPAAKKPAAAAKAAPKKPSVKKAPAAKKE